MNYEEMSDFEINKAVHFKMIGTGKVKERYRLSKADFVDVFHNEFGENPGPAVIAVMCYVRDGVSDGYNPFGGAFDYCNNPSDAMPILVENKIGFKWFNGSCTASSVLRGYHESTSNNPLRAAMIVFLMMNEKE